MSSTSGPEHLSGHHRDTLLQIFQQKTNHNVEWHDVVSLLEAVGSIEQQHDDMFVFRIGQETEVLRRPSDKDIDGQQLVDLRRILTSAGYDTVAADLEDRGKEAEHRRAHVRGTAPNCSRLGIPERQRVTASEAPAEWPDGPSDA